MDAQLLLHGQIWEVRPNSYMSKKDGKEKSIDMLEVTVEQVIKEGDYRRKSVEKINYKIEDLSSEQVDLLLNSIDKFIFIPYEFRTWQKGGIAQSAVMPNSSFMIFDKNPFNQIVKTTSHDVKKSA